MDYKTLTAANGRRLGQIADDGKRQVATAANGRRLGVYDKQSDITVDNSGKRVGFGNLLGMLLNRDDD